MCVMFILFIVEECTQSLAGNEDLQFGVKRLEMKVSGLKLELEQEREKTEAILRQYQLMQSDLRDVGFDFTNHGQN